VPDALACEADAPQALTRFVAGLQTTLLHDSPVRPTPHDGKRGRPSPEAQPAQMVYHIAGALASRLTDRQARVDQQSCCILATNELDEGQVAPQAVLDGYTGQGRAERGFRFLKAPQCVAASLSLKKPERIMALLMVMTVCLLVYAALEYRIRTALKEHGATFPDQKGHRIPNPTTRWVFHYFVGIHVLYIPGQGLMILNLTDEHQHLLELLGKRYAWFYR
jgi:transposase